MNTTLHIPQNDTWTFVECFWWGLMTITTVGYDSSPKTLLGKVFAGFCALSGVFCLTLPIPIIVNSFAGFYKNRLWRNEVTHKKKERLSEAKAAIKKKMEEKGEEEEEEKLVAL